DGSVHPGGGAALVAEELRERRVVGGGASCDLTRQQARARVFGEEVALELLHLSLHVRSAPAPTYRRTSMKKRTTMVRRAWGTEGSTGAAPAMATRVPTSITGSHQTPEPRVSNQSEARRVSARASREALPAARYR